MPIEDQPARPLAKRKKRNKPKPWGQIRHNSVAARDDLARPRLEDLLEDDIGDRAGDIYELFCTAQEAGTHFLLRTCVDRLARDGSRTISEEMKNVRVQGSHRIEVRYKATSTTSSSRHYEGDK
jgi:hypothetical protein